MSKVLCSCVPTLSNLDCLEHRLSLRAAGVRAGVGDEPLDAGELGVGHVGLSPVLDAELT